MTHKEKWLASMIAKHGSVEAVTKFMQDAQKKSRENYKGTGGYYGNKELAREMGRKGAQKRWHNVHTNNTNTKTKDDQGRQVAETPSGS